MVFIYIGLGMLFVGLLLCVLEATKWHGWAYIAAWAENMAGFCLVAGLFLTLGAWAWVSIARSDARTTAEYRRQLATAPIISHATKCARCGFAGPLYLSVLYPYDDTRRLVEMQCPRCRVGRRMILLVPDAIPGGGR
jgi:predicted RNA-binding Zn-ribbon protein involved in translation (DUF1610 family)